MPRLSRTVTLLLLLAVLATTPVVAAASTGPDPVGTWPLRPEPEVASAFVAPASPWAAGHRGVDLVGTPGQQVRAALPGTVTFAGSVAGRVVVTVDHGGTRTTYEPVDRPVAVGTRVAAGTPLGRLAATPSHCAPRACLHWGWIATTAGSETYRDPLRLVGAGPVRLLPLWGGVASPAPERPGNPYAALFPGSARMPPWGP